MNVCPEAAAAVIWSHPTCPSDRDPEVRDGKREGRIGHHLSFLYELPGLAATRADVLTYVSRVFWETVRARYRRWAMCADCTDVEVGAVTGVHPFGYREARHRAACTSSRSPPRSSCRGLKSPRRASCPPRT